MLEVFVHSANLPSTMDCPTFKDVLSYSTQVDLGSRVS